jgi:hypothetical protein
MVVSRSDAAGAVPMVSAHWRRRRVVNRKNDAARGPMPSEPIVFTLCSPETMPEREDRDGAYLVFPNLRGGWALAAWDGGRFYDPIAGEVLRPIIWAELPPLHRFMTVAVAESTS